MMDQPDKGLLPKTGASIQQALVRTAEAASISQSLARELDRMRSVLEPFDLSLHTQIIAALEPMRRLQDEVAKTFQSQQALTSQIRDLAMVNTRLADVVRSVQIDTRWIEDMTRVHTTWSRQVRHLEPNLGALRGIAQLSIADSCRSLAVSDRILAQIELRGIREGLRLSKSVIQFHELSAKLAADYRRFVESVPTLSDVVALPEWSIKHSSTELFITNYALRAALVEDVAVDQESDELAEETAEAVADCSALLATVNPSLVKLLDGARAAIEQQQPDAARHVMASLRELWSHMLRMLAPDELVLPWLPKSNTELIHAGKPTRKARLLYVCREIDSEPLSRFVVRDSEASLELINVFQRVHELEPSLTISQLKALVLRTESWILYILRLRG